MEPEDLQSQFENFFKSEEYRKKLANLCTDRKTSLNIDFADIISFESDFAKDLIQNPKEALEILTHAAGNQLCIEDPEYSDKIKGLTMRIYDLYDLTPLRKIGADQINKLIMIHGIVVKTTTVKPKIIKAAFECRRCGERQFIPQTTPFLQAPIYCENPSCKRAGPFAIVPDESEFINVQDVWIQENSDQLPPGQLPRTLHVKFIDELVDTARPGDNISIVGIVKILPRHVKGGKLNTFNLFLEANSIKILGKEPEAIPDTTEIKQIRELGKDPWIHRKILASIAPSIYDYESVKEAIIYLLFGGVPKQRQDIKIRGELNILLVGDPGTAKSQLLQYVARLAPRGLYTSGRGTSGVGLTAAVLKDKTSGEYSLQAGVLVLADRGVACIDELDKMNEDDRNNIHEPLEQGTVSIAKGGIVATLNARTAVLAAANPRMGRYNPFESLADNLKPLPVTLLSRFDLIFLMLDVPDPDRDSKLATHILNIHSDIGNEPPIPLELLRKYIAYARTIKPSLTPEARERIKNFYLKMRKASGTESAITIGPRQLEALTRISEARARATLREEILVEDAEAAIRIMMKSLEEVGIDVTTGKPDIDLIMTGKPKSLRDKTSVVIKLIVELQRETGMVEKRYLIKQLEETYSINNVDAERIISNLLREGVIFSPREGYIKKT